MKKLFNKKGFTLIELIVVIAIIAALMLLIVPTMNGFVDTAKKQANTANAKSVYTAIQASKTAAATEVFGSKKMDVTLCGAGAPNAYSEFWAGALPSECTIAGDKVTFGTGTLAGNYPE